jgi:hypothetical protein
VEGDKRIELGSVEEEGRVKRIEEKDGERIGWKRRLWNGEGRSRFEEVVMD